MTPEKPSDERQVRARQRSRAIVTALLLAAFALLMYLITIARMSG